MFASTYRLARFRRLSLLLLMLSAWNAGALVARECTAVDQNGLPRECTASEVLGACAVRAYDSWVTCRLASSSWWSYRNCDFWAAVDLIGCYPSTARDVLFRDVVLR